MRRALVAQRVMALMAIGLSGVCLALALGLAISGCGLFDGPTVAAVAQDPAVWKQVNDLNECRGRANKARSFQDASVAEAWAVYDACKVEAGIDEGGAP